MAIFYVQATAPNTNDGSSWATATSLQTALTNANAGDEIWLAQGIYSPGNNPTDTFTINNAVQIYGGFIGNEATLDERDWQTNQTILEGNGTNNTVVTAQSTADAALIDGVIIQGGNAPDDGGGIRNQTNSQLTVQNTIIRDNQAADDGGGIRNDGELIIVNSNVTDNTSVGTTATSGGGGLLNTVGASVTIINSTFSGNTALNGGGIRNDGTLTFTNSTLSDNIAATSGGGIANTLLPGVPPTLATATITNSTITNNQVQTTGNSGGGIANFGNLSITNSIVAANVDDDDIVDVIGTTTTGGNNLIGNGDEVAGLTNGVSDDQVGTAAAPLDPQLGPLQDNGGFTQTHTPQAGSPVIDAGNAATLPADTADLDDNNNVAEAIPVDQRGQPFNRLLGTTVDIGAVEGVGVPAGITISPTTGLITTEAGGTDSFTVVLDSQPSNDVFVNFISEDPTEGTVSPLVTFSTINWDQPQTVLITGTDDADDDGDTAYIINTSVTSTDNRYDALLLDTLSVTNLDDDEPIPGTGGPTPPPPVTTLSSQGERLVVGGMGDVPIELSISQLSSDQVREIIIFETDGTGAVNGLTINDAGYLDAVLNTAQVVFSTLEAGDIDELNPQRTITVAAGSILQFAVISDGSLDSVRRGAGGTVNLTGVSSQADVVELQTLNGGSVQARFDINQTGEFSQLVINAVAANESVPIGAELQGLNTDSELFDLRAQTGLLTATIDVYREASLDNVVGLFVVENEQGQVRDDMGVLLSPGDDGYGQAALAQRININLVGTNDETVRYTTQILGGQLLSTFLVVDGTVGELLDMDTTNDPSIYFTHTLGNSDGADHVRLLGNNTFGFEDLPGGGDADFDDVVIRATFA